MSQIAIKAERIEPKLTAADKRALRSQNGAGNYSTACFERLKGHGLVDDSFMLTELGWELRSRVGGSTC